MNIKIFVNIITIDNLNHFNPPCHGPYFYEYGLFLYFF